MNQYRSKRNIVMAMDMVAIVLSFVTALGLRFKIMIKYFNMVDIITLYVTFFAFALLLYVFVFLIRRMPLVEKQSYRELIITTIEQQIVFMAAYIVFFFAFHRAEIVSRLFLGMFFVGNVILCSLVRVLYHNYCIRKIREYKEKIKNAPVDTTEVEGLNKPSVQHVYLIGSKSIGQYGGYESFVMNLLQHHANNPKLKYHVSCKANGSGFMDTDKLPGAITINDEEFTYCNAHCYKIPIPEKIGAAQAIYYDLRALEWACDHIEKNHISHPIVYILASRIGPFERKFVRRIHEAEGLVMQNPDGHEDWRRKWHPIVRKYWKLSEKHAVKHADLVVCDSKNIEEYIREEYNYYNPKTTFIAYGSNINPSKLADDDKKYTSWLENHNLKDGKYYISVGRFVPENNFDIMIREFMLSNTEKDFAIITTDNPKYAAELQQKYQYKNDKRIKFVGSVYDTELLGKIRENAYGYFHGHEVGGTNPSLLESLGTTNLNLLLDVGFNREVAEDAALYWTKEEGNLASLIDRADKMDREHILEMGDKAKQRIRDEYSWEYICDKYKKIFL